LYLSTKNNNTALQLFKKDLLKSFNVKKFFKKFFKKFKNKRLFCVLGTNRFFFYFKGKCLKILKQKGYSINFNHNKTFNYEKHKKINFD